MKTMIAVPCMDSVPVQFCQSLALLDKVGEVTLAMKPGSLIYNSRNELAKMAIESGAEFVLWLDSDMVFPPDLLVRMSKTLLENGWDILTGIYFKRMPPFGPVLFDRVDQLPDGKLQADKTETIPDFPWEVGGCGFGGVFMRTEVLMATALDHGGKLFEPENGAGEDIAFCIRARKSGYKVICDPSIELGHVGHQVVTRDYYTALAAKGGQDAGKS